MENLTAKIGDSWPNGAGGCEVVGVGNHPRTGEPVAFVRVAGLALKEIVCLSELPARKALDARREESRRASRQREAERCAIEEKRREAEKTERRNLDGFLAGLSTLAAGKARKVLETPLRYRGEVSPRWRIVETLIGEGRKAGEFCGKAALIGEDGTALQCTKTEADFAGWLANARG